MTLFNLGQRLQICKSRPDVAMRFSINRSLSVYRWSVENVINRSHVGSYFRMCVGSSRNTFRNHGQFDKRRNRLKIVFRSHCVTRSDMVPPKYSTRQTKLYHHNSRLHCIIITISQNTLLSRYVPAGLPRIRPN